MKSGQSTQKVSRQSGTRPALLRRSMALNARQQRSSFVEELVANYKLQNGDNLLFEAVRQRNVDILIHFVCASPQSVLHRNDIGVSPLLCALRMPQNMECVVVLITAGAILSQSDFEKAASRKHLIGDSLINLLKCSVSGRRKKDPTSVSGLLGEICFGKIQKIQNMKRVSLRNRLLAAVKFAKTLNSDNADKEEWRKLFAGENQKEMKRKRSKEVKATLRLSEMRQIPKRQRFESVLGAERQQKGVRIIANTFKRIGFLDNVRD